MEEMLLGTANSQTGLCTVMFGGQVVHFTRFHVLTGSQANSGAVNAVGSCPKSTTSQIPFSQKKSRKLEMSSSESDEPKWGSHETILSKISSLQSDGYDDDEIIEWLKENYHPRKGYPVYETTSSESDEPKWGHHETILSKISSLQSDGYDDDKIIEWLKENYHPKKGYRVKEMSSSSSEEDQDYAAILAARKTLWNKISSLKVDGYGDAELNEWLKENYPYEGYRVKGGLIYFHARVLTKEGYLIHKWQVTVR
jgi:hypothetical protein